MGIWIFQTRLPSPCVLCVQPLPFGNPSFLIAAQIPLADSGMPRASQGAVPEIRDSRLAFLPIPPHPPNSVLLAYLILLPLLSLLLLSPKNLQAGVSVFQGLFSTTLSDK